MRFCSNQNQYYTFYDENKGLRRLSSQEINEQFEDKKDRDRIRNRLALVNKTTGKLISLPLDQVQTALEQHIICQRSQFHRVTKANYAKRGQRNHLRQLNNKKYNCIIEKAHNKDIGSDEVDSHSVTETDSEHDNSTTSAQANSIIPHTTNNHTALGPTIHVQGPATASAYIYFDKNQKLKYVLHTSLKDCNQSKRIRFYHALVNQADGQYITCTNENKILEAVATNRIVTKEKFKKLSHKNSLSDDITVDSATQPDEQINNNAPPAVLPQHQSVNGMVTRNKAKIVVQENRYALFNSNSVANRRKSNLQQKDKQVYAFGKK